MRLKRTRCRQRYNYRLNRTINDKNLKYEIETYEPLQSQRDACDPINDKNLKYEIETGEPLRDFIAGSITINDKNLKYEIETPEYDRPCSWNLTLSMIRISSMRLKRVINGFIAELSGAYQ